MAISFFFSLVVVWVFVLLFFLNQGAWTCCICRCTFPAPSSFVRFSHDAKSFTSFFHEVKRKRAQTQSIGPLLVSSVRMSSSSIEKKKKDEPGGAGQASVIDSHRFSCLFFSSLFGKRLTTKFPFILTSHRGETEHTHTKKRDQKRHPQHPSPLKTKEVGTPGRDVAYQ